MWIRKNGVERYDENYLSVRYDWIFMLTKPSIQEELRTLFENAGYTWFLMTEYSNEKEYINNVDTYSGDGGCVSTLVVMPINLKDSIEFGYSYSYSSYSGIDKIIYAGMKDINLTPLFPIEEYPDLEEMTPDQMIFSTGVAIINPNRDSLEYKPIIYHCIMDLD